jgi:adenosine deaminase
MTETEEVRMTETEEVRMTETEEVRMTETEELIRLLPKAELHLHIEGTLEPELKFELAARNNVDLPYVTVEEMRAAYDFDDLPSFLTQYYEGMTVLLTEDDFYDLAMAYFRRVAAQNVVYVEMFFDPQAHTTRGIDFGTVISGFHRAQADAEEQFGIRSQLIMCFLRDMTADSAAETLDQAGEYRDWIVGVGLDSDERDNPPIKFREVFADARSQGYRLTMHCDVDQADSVAHIWQCLDDIGVERIDHGVNSLEDDGLVAEIVARGIGLTVCPISNGYVTDGNKSQEIKTMLDKGMLVTINSDDPAYFPGYLTENLVTVQREARLRNDEVAGLVRNGFLVSWLGDGEKAEYLDRLDQVIGTL